MAFCRECGKEINDKAVVCPNWGCSTGVKGLPTDTTDKDTGVLGWFLFSFILPCAGSVLFGLLWGLALCFVGVIMGLVWKDSRPYCSKACLKGSLCGFAFIALFALVDVLFLNNFFNL